MASKTTPAAILFQLGKAAPPAFRETPCYVYRKGGDRFAKRLQAIPESAISDDDTTTVFAALEEYIERWALKEDLYSDAERAERDETDADPMVFHPGVSLEAARKALEQGGFRVLEHTAKKGPPPLLTAADALTRLEHHLEHSSLALAQKTSAATFSHHHLEQASSVLTRAARASFGAEFLAAVKKAAPGWPREAQQVLQFLVKRELANPEGSREVRELRALAPAGKAAPEKAQPVKTTQKSVRRGAG